MSTWQDKLRSGGTLTDLERAVMNAEIKASSDSDLGGYHDPAEHPHYAR